MSRIAYTYCVVRYVHDPGAGEVLNAGVILYAPTTRTLKLRVDERYRRFSAAFKDFDGDLYRTTLRRLQQSVGAFDKQQSELLARTEAAPSDVLAIGKQFWADQDLSFQFGSVQGGTSDDLEEAVEELFHRFVLTQVPTGKEVRRSNEDVWSAFRPYFSRLNLTASLEEKTFEQNDFRLTFDHAFRNEKWHALQPLSLDYRNSEQIQKQATLWLGNGAALAGTSDLGKLYLLLGRPHIAANRRAYENAKSLLGRMQVESEIIEEDAAEDFARELAAYFRSHGIGEGGFHSKV